MPKTKQAAPRKWTPDYDRIADTILWLLDQPLPAAAPADLAAEKQPA